LYKGSREKMDYDGYMEETNFFGVSIEKKEFIRIKLVES